MITPNREELAWAAGFFDGEGTTHLGRKTQVRNGQTFGPYLQLTVSVAQATAAAECLDRLQRAVGGVGRFYPMKSRGARQPQTRWQVMNREHSQAVIAMLWPFLCEPKREQAAGCLQALLDNDKKRLRPVRPHRAKAGTPRSHTPKEPQ